jgi:hypothetical protein
MQGDKTKECERGEEELDEKKKLLYFYFSWNFRSDKFHFLLLESERNNKKLC